MGIDGLPIPATIHPNGALTMNMNTLPIGLFERFLITAFRTIPVTPSPNAMNSDGTIASQGSSTIYQIRVIEDHHINVNLTSF
tara:strand:+ start:1678 stop:1926 length:249 start_codon:yes stop_codon:yes gene_type:complete